MKYLGPNAELDCGPALAAELDEAVLSIALNRPQQGNSLNSAMMQAMQQLLMAVARDDAVRVLVLRGNGANFCAGSELAGEEAVALGIGSALAKLTQPVIAMVYGRCCSAAMDWIAFCDIVLAADDAEFDSYGKQAQRNDVVTRTVPQDELEAQTYQLARELAGKDALALRFTKQTLQQVATLGWDEVLGFTSAKQAELKLLQVGGPSARATAVERFLAGETKPGKG